MCREMYNVKTLQRPFSSVSQSGATTTCRHEYTYTITIGLEHDVYSLLQLRVQEPEEIVK